MASLIGGTEIKFNCWRNSIGQSCFRTLKIRLKTIFYLTFLCYFWHSLFFLSRSKFLSKIILLLLDYFPLTFFCSESSPHNISRFLFFWKSLFLFLHFWKMYLLDIESLIDIFSFHYIKNVTSLFSSTHNFWGEYAIVITHVMYIFSHLNAFKILFILFFGSEYYVLCVCVYVCAFVCVHVRGRERLRMYVCKLIWYSLSFLGLWFIFVFFTCSKLLGITSMLK